MSKHVDKFAMEILELARIPNLVKRINEKKLKASLKKLPTFKTAMADAELLDELDAALDSKKGYGVVWILLKITHELHAEWHNADGAPPEDEPEGEDDEGEIPGGKNLDSISEAIKEFIGVDMEKDLEKYPRVHHYYMKWGSARKSISMGFFKLKRGIHVTKKAISDGIVAGIKKLSSRYSQNTLAKAIAIFILLLVSIVKEIIVIFRLILNPEKGLEAAGIDIGDID